MIIPSLLTDNIRIAEERIHLAQHMSGWLHLDLLDNSLYKYTSLSLEELEQLDFGALMLEVHSMTDDPSAIILNSKLPMDRLIIHYEMKDWHQSYDDSIRKGIDTWLAIDPTTKIEDVNFPNDLSGIVLMGVMPGQSGQSIDEKVYDRLDKLKNFYPDVTITIDGGVNKDTIRQLIAHGADNLVTAKALFSESNPVATYEEFVRLSDPLNLKVGS